MFWDKKKIINLLSTNNIETLKEEGEDYYSVIAAHVNRLAMLNDTMKTEFYLLYLKYMRSEISGIVCGIFFISAN